MTTAANEGFERWHETMKNFNYTKDIKSSKLLTFPDFSR